MDMADTFDILLFKTDTASAKAIRGHSDSEWDHAAMVLKFGTEPDGVFIIDATSNHGVSIRNFARIQNLFGNFYTKVAVRHLEWERPDACLEQLEQLLEEVSSHEYNISMSKNLL